MQNVNNEKDIEMKNLLIAATMFLGLTTASYAADPLNADRSGFFIGGDLGSSVNDKTKIDVGATAGYQVNKYLRVEADYTHAWKLNNNGDRLVANVVGQYRIPNSTVTPYVFTGAGVGFAGLGSLKNGEYAVVGDLGAGLRVAVSDSVELDARYTKTRPLDDKNVSLKNDDMFTVGANYRF